MIHDAEKSKEQLFNELTALRQRHAELEATVQKQQQTVAAFGEREAYYRLLAEHVTDVIWIRDMQLRPLYISPSVTRLRGYSVEEAMTQTICESLTPASREAAQQALARALSVEQSGAGSPDRFTTIELEVTRKDGSTVWVELRATFLRDEAGRPIGIVGVNHDISERKRTEEMLGQAYDTLERRVQSRTANLRRVNAQLRAEITKRQQAEEARRQSEERFRRLVTESLQGIMIHRAGTPVFANQAYAEMYGYDTPEDILRVENIFQEIIAPEDRARLYHYFQCRLRGEPAPTHYTCRGVRRDGTYIWVENLITVVQWEGDIAIQCSVVDISERKRSEHALRESEERFRNLIEGSLQGILIHRDDRALFVNESYAAIFGYDNAEDIYNLDSLLALIAPHEHQRLLHYYHDRLAGKEAPKHYEYQGVRKDGALVWLDMQVRTMHWGGVDAVQSTVVDISERKRAEEERQKLETQLRQAQKMESIGTLAGGIAHEFNNMLTVILGFTELAQTEIPSTVTARLHLQEVHQAGLRAKELVQQILTFSRPSEQARKPLQLAQVAQEALSLIRATLPSTITIRARFTTETSQVLANQTQLHQVMFNLCSNAEYAMRETGGILDITVDTVQVDATWSTLCPQLLPAAYVRLTVHDAGHGIAPEVKDRIFDPFFSTKDVGEGTGMGLAIVHGIVTSHSGVITIESMPGKGTTCTIYLPQYVETGGDTGVAAHGEHRGTPGQGRILFVDDEEMLVRLAQLQLEHLGYEVVAHTASLEALEAFRADPNGFALVITDQTMPTMTGTMLMEALRHTRPDIPIILCTGFSYLINDVKATALGVDAFMTKPATLHELATIVKQVLDKRTAARQNITSLRLPTS